MVPGIPSAAPGTLTAAAVGIRCIAPAWLEVEVVKSSRIRAETLSHRLWQLMMSQKDLC